MKQNNMMTFKLHLFVVLLQHRAGVQCPSVLSFPPSSQLPADRHGILPQSSPLVASPCQPCCLPGLGAIQNSKGRNSINATVLQDQCNNYYLICKIYD